MRDMVSRRLRRASRDDQGLTLVEMVIALIVLSIVLTAMASALIAGMVASNIAEVRSRAVQLAAKYVEADQSVNWKFLGHTSTDLAGQTFYKGESIVRLDPTVDTTVTDIPQAGPVSVSYAGTTFQVETYITWAGSSAASPNDGTTYAAKRITIVITWAPRDGAHTFTTVALRAPSAGEMKPPSNYAVPITFSSATAAPAQTLDVAGDTTNPVILTAKTTATATAVTASYSLADGTQQTVNLVGDALLTTWSGTIATGVGPLAAGTMPITFTAVTPSGGQATSTANLKLTAYTPPALTLSSPTVVIGSGQPSDAVLSSTGSGYVTAQPMTVSVVANTTPQSITASFPLSGGTQSTPQALAYDSASGTYTYTFPVGTGPLAPGNLIVTFAATPAGGGASVTSTASVTLTSPSLGAVSVAAVATPAKYFKNGDTSTPTWPWTGLTPLMCVNNGNNTSWSPPFFYVALKNLSSSDSVTASLSNVTSGYNSGPISATYVGSGTYGMLFKVVWPGTVKFQTAASTLTVNATRAVDSTSMSPAYTTAVTFVSKNSSNSC